MLWGYWKEKNRIHNIDSLGDIEYWIRDLSRIEGSFWLQTSTDKFYPDFVCMFKDSRYMAIEYKGDGRYVLNVTKTHLKALNHGLYGYRSNLILGKIIMNYNIKI